ncbi:recombination protein NinG [Glaesserella parasuis]|uniref:recombination protein NinG n=1 Tax=Glaesserella parasuis TaxID=738 RepID=UPI0004228C71|nr:recombination protein NinG [Glaesserella parasuis]MDE4032478.1 recombination protein NinG [Glaesserella parasuis]MDG6857144.1 recombination protein NinG [Glaesserella parasuis]MDO9647031.1 recombination protein NinG [Glaesserella parasuis]MDO9893206.1 recombination protein NinG [Glaesserella parasuis]MEE3696167.1 recombination protein NinG [Glaesserella parasuis]
MIKPKVKARKCKCCGGEFKSADSFRKWCSPDCGVKLAKIAQEKSRQKAIEKRNREERAKIKATRERLKSRAEWLRDAQAVFNEYIRLRDKDEPCISCQRFHQGQYHAGHYRTVKAMPELRFSEDNVHKQCSACNNHLSGNITEYRINLVRKIGAERVEALESYHPPVKWSVEDCKEIIKTYKAKIKELKCGG